MDTNRKWLQEQLAEIKKAGLFKEERVITGPQGSSIDTESGPALNFCANNYLGLSSHPEILDAARQGLDEFGYGLSSVRFICGTQSVHKKLEQKIANFLGMEDSILYISCFDANGGLFESLLSKEDAVISDALNHASIIDGVRLCKAQRYRYANADMADLERCLKESADARFRMIVTDGVFSMHGSYAPLPEICDLAEKYNAMVVVDDSHATGFVGKTGRGTIEHFGVEGRVDIITSTLGKALGGATGGFTAASKEVVSMLRQRSRPYLFSNTMPPMVAAASLAVLDLIDKEGERVQKVQANTAHFRERMAQAGFDLGGDTHPIVPIMIGDELKTMEMASAMNDRGIFVVGFSYPVVPKGEARIRVQISAAHEIAEIDRAVDDFIAVGREVGLLK